MAQDITMLMRYKPLLDAMYMDIVGGGGAGGGTKVFPATILGDGFGPYANSYQFAELENNVSTDIKNGGETGFASNIWEIAQDRSGNGFVSPGAGCLGDVFPAASNLVLTIGRVEPPMCVIMYKTTVPPGGIGDDVGYEYFFSCPTPMCVACGPEEDAPAGDGTATQSEAPARPRTKRVFENIPLLEKLGNKINIPYDR